MDAGDARSERASQYVKACCAAWYGSELVQLFLGGSLHPGGDELSRRLADLTGIGPGDRVLDVASGRGTTARMLAAERAAVVRGVDLSPRLVLRAEREAEVARLDDLVGFELGDAENLPVRDASFDVVVCECALSAFPDKAAAASGFRRALVPGGRVGVSDVTLERDRLPRELDTPIGRVACVADALPTSGYEHLLRAAGFADILVEPHAEAALATVERVQESLEAAQEMLRGLFDVKKALRLAELARRSVLDGVLGYALITGRTPGSPKKPTGHESIRDPVR